ncbi:MAG: LysM peptidoglycan-binding domain-containing protein [Desulfarculus sp.]|nr:LysM peptidoglycan-binding domain-containing protein [Desulfarculus sp.]
MASPYEPMGPRLDISQEPEEPPFATPRRASLPARPPGRGGGALGTVLAVIAMVLSLLGLGMALWTVTALPERVPGPLPSPDVVAGGTGERVAKLEKDVSGLMLRLVTLEKELEALRGRAGAITKLTELSAKVAALQERLDALAPGHRPAPRSEAPAAPAVKAAPRPEARAEARAEARPETKAPPKPAAKAAPEPAPKPAAKAESGVRAQVKAVAEEVAESGSPKKNKVVYTVKRGDTLFTVAQRFKVSMKDIQRWNDLKPGQPIQIDQRLDIYQ